MMYGNQRQGNMWMMGNTPDGAMDCNMNRMANRDMGSIVFFIRLLPRCWCECSKSL